MADVNREDIFENMKQDVLNSKLDEVNKNKMLKNILHLQSQEINIMITGATGSGKSSTINALFDADVAKVGIGVDPETMDIHQHFIFFAFRQGRIQNILPHGFKNIFRVVCVHNHTLLYLMPRSFAAFM